MTRYSAETLDISRLAAPTLVPTGFEALLAARLAHFATLWEAARAKDPTLPAIDTTGLETEPATVLSQEFAFGDMLLRQAINDIANTLRLAKASGADLDHIAQTYLHTARIVLDAGDPTANPARPAVYEGDDEYRARAQLAPEAYPTVGMTPGGYVYRVKRAFGYRVKDVRPLRRPGGVIDLVLLARAGDGAAPETLVGDVQAAFAGEDAQQSTDDVTARGATIAAVPVSVLIGIRAGPDPTPIIAAARERIAALGVERHAIGETLHLAAIGAAASAPGVRWANVISPLDDVSPGPAGAPWISSISVAVEIEP